MASTLTKAQKRALKAKLKKEAGVVAPARTPRKRSVSISKSSRGTARSMTPTAKYVKHPVLASGAAASTARAICLPLSYSVRLPVSWDIADVAVANPFSVSVANRTATVVANRWASGGYLCGVSRDPLRFFMQTWDNTAGTFWSYISRFTNSNANLVSVGTNYALGRLRVDPSEPVSMDLHPAVFVYSNGVRGYDDQQFTCKHEGYTYVWVDSGDVNPTTSSAINCTLYTLDTGGTTIVASTLGDLAKFEVIPLGADSGFDNPFTLSSGIAQVVITTSGFYRFRVSWQATFSLVSEAYLELTLYGVTSTVQFLPIPGIVARDGEITGLQMVGCSVMVSVDSADMAKGGRAFGVQLADDELPTSYLPTVFTDSLTDQVSTRVGVVELALENGIYGWHRPISMDCFRFQKPFLFNPTVQSTGTNVNLATSKQQVIGYNSVLYPHGGWLMVAVQGPPAIITGGSPFPGSLFRVTIASSVCIKTTSPWYGLAHAKSRVTEEELIKVLEGIPLFSENPFHWKDITTWIARNSKTLTAVAKAGLTALVGSFAPEFLPVVEAVNAMY